MLGILVNVALLIFWVPLLYFFKRNTVILFGVGLGIGVFLLAGSIEFHWFKITGIALTEKESKTVITPIVEESSKMFFIFLVAWISRLSRLLSKVELFGASVGLGFAFIENFGVITNPLNVLSRGFFSWPMHMITATLLSYRVGGLLKSKSKRNLAWTLISLMIAIIIHSVFNYTVLYFGFG